MGCRVSLGGQRVRCRVPIRWPRRSKEIPLDPARWVAKACEIVDRDLTQEEWDRLVPGDEPFRSVCGNI